MPRPPESATGLLGPDEPRCASIAREMARSGDWITPRLRPDLAPRLPVALVAASCLLFFFWILRRECGARAASFANLILGTYGGWLVSSQVGVPDMPMAAAFSAAMLLALPWIAAISSAL